MKKLILLLSLTIPVWSGVVNAQKPAVVTSKEAGWHKNGETTASMKAEKDAIMVMGADKFKAIKMKVTDAPIHIASMKVYYSDGDAEDIDVKSDMNAGANTKVFNLKSTKDVQKVEFVYNTVKNSNN